MRFAPAMTVLAAMQSTINVSNDVMTDSLVAAVNGVHNSCRVNTDMMNLYTGGEIPTTEINGKPVLLTFGAIHGAQMKILIDSEMTPNLTLKNTERAATTVLDTLQYSVPDTVVALMNKKAELKAAGLVEVVKNSLDLLLYNHETAGKAIHLKVNQGNKTINDALTKEVQDVTAKLIEGVKMFSS